MEWQHPEWLYLILPLGVAWLALALGGRRRRQRAALAFVASPMGSRILPADSRLRFWMKTLLREVALIAGLVALAGPRFGTQYEEVVPRGSDLYVLIDVSRSMLASDVPPSRLARAKADVAALVNRLNGERVGLIAFAGQAVVKCPLTVDYDAFRRSLDELDPASAPRGGTAIGDALRKALEVFQARAERDQAMLLITDGDDQQSYPLEAAAVAAERHVTIFTVGLGDADQGARVPQGADSASFVEYEGQQVWSKLDSSLLKDIALKTNGVYVPVGTRAYDLGELYVDHLQGRRGGDGAHQQRIRRSERFQPFLALALFALVADLCTARYRMAPPSTQADGMARNPGFSGRSVSLSALLLVCCLAAFASADEPEAAFREGLRLYSQDEFASARDKFAAAAEEFGKDKAADRAAIAAFNEACASHRQGEVEKARTLYLEAGLSRDKPLSAAAYFNLGTLEAEEARKLAGEHPENAPPENREKIFDQLKSAVVSFRRSLELQPDDARARHDIELVRLWIKYYTDQWREHDRSKRRQESNLLEFLEFLIEAQTALRESAKVLPETATADTFAELKRAQEELHDEIEPLKDKIESDLKPQQPAGAGTQPPNAKELEDATALLRQWADAAGEKMSTAADHLGARQATPATVEQQNAIDELERIWEAVIPFRPLLARDLADQTLIAKAIEPSPSGDDAASDNSDLDDSNRDQDGEQAHVEGEHETDDRQASVGHPTLEAQGEDLARLTEIQTRTLRRTQLLKLKAEAELERLEQLPPQPAGSQQDDARADDNNADGNKTDDKEAGDVEAEEDVSKEASADGDDAAGGDSATSANPPAIDPEQLKAGYAKAIELAPKAVEQMQAALKFLTQGEREAAYSPAEEARKILEEIEKAQPREERPQDQDQKNQDEKEQDKKDQENKEQEKKDQERKDQDQENRDKKEQESNDQEQKDQEQKDQDEKDKDEEGKDKQDQKKPSPEKKEQQPLSRDRIEEALRKVRERQQEKRERDRKIKARVLGRVPVEKDW